MKIAILGYGKMGKTIERLAVEKGHSVVLATNRHVKASELSLADVAIEFSTPDAVVENLKACFEQNIPVVCGTTGWLDAYDEILNFCKTCNGSFIYASNFSVGVNLFFELNKTLAQLMAKHSDYIPSIEEIHHTQKKDAPSGTAISLAEQIVANSEYTRWGLIEDNREIEQQQLPITAIRKGDVKGAHTVCYDSAVDSIQIKHQAHSREGFALGAILASEWLADKKGVYSMRDVLGL